MQGDAKKYKDGYFKERLGNDRRRQDSFLQERKFIEAYTSLDGIVCDVGCSTGEFLQSIGWRGPKYGMEVNAFAIENAKERGISFDHDITRDEAFFDVVIFRGTVQHLPDPFTYLWLAYKALKPNGLIFFLATPNANSLVYKLFNTLPALSPSMNYYIPSDVTLENILRNIGFKCLKTEYPYWDSPYSSPAMDHLKFVTSVLTRKRRNFAFWKQMMNMVAVKEGQV